MDVHFSRLVLFRRDIAGGLHTCATGNPARSQHGAAVRVDMRRVEPTRRNDTIGQCIRAALSWVVRSPPH
jgi:hypothetical protein